MHEVHGAGIHRDVSGTQGGNRGGRGIEAHEMHVDIAVVLEGCGDRQAGGEGPAEAVDKYVDGLTLVCGEGRVNGLAVEVGASDVPFERDIVCGL